MLMTKEKQPAIQTVRGWAISVLQEAGAICECEEHGWMQDRADPHARERALDIAQARSAGWLVFVGSPRRDSGCAGFDRGYLSGFSARGPLTLRRADVGVGVRRRGSLPAGLAGATFGADLGSNRTPNNVEHDAHPTRLTGRSR